MGGDADLSALITLVFGYDAKKVSVSALTNAGS